MSEPVKSEMKKKIASHAIALGLGALLCFALFPKPEPKIEIREKVKVEEKVVEKEVVKWKDRIVEVKVKDTKTKVITKIVEVEKPSGEKVKTTEVVETDDSTEKANTEKVSEGERVVEKLVEKLVYRDVFIKQEPVLSQWVVSGLVGVGEFAPPLSLIYGGLVQRRIIGNIWVGVWATTSPNAGLALTLEF